MLADEFILNLDNVKLENKDLLPEYSGIYYVIDSEQIIWYIGRSINLQRRWNNEKPHHLFHQLISIASQENRQFFIYYDQVAIKKLRLQEKKQIAKYQPRLNYTPVVKYVSQSLEQNYYGSAKSDHNYNLKIISKYNLLNTERKELEHFQKEKTIMITENAPINDEEEKKDFFDSNDVNLKQFKRKFIDIKNEEIGLNLQIEICIDPRNRLFVRHYTLFNIYGWGIKIINKKNDEVVDSCFLNLNSQCYKLYKFSFKWLGYKLSCEDILLIDEEDDFEIETPAIMLPFRMFVDLVEYLWLSNSSLSKNLQEQETAWFKNQDLSTKIAKWLHDNNMTLNKLVEQLK
jgi:hypothetical protein